MTNNNQRMMKAYDKLATARRHLHVLVEAKSDHKWTNEECAALVDLCDTLDVPIPGAKERCND